MMMLFGFSIALQVFTWGRNKYGQLGHSDGGTIPRPTRLNGLSKEGVVHVACGGDHTLAITRKGELYTVRLSDWSLLPQPTAAGPLLKANGVNSCNFSEAHSQLFVGILVLRYEVPAIQISVPSRLSLVSRRDRSSSKKDTWSHATIASAFHEPLRFY